MAAVTLPGRGPGFHAASAVPSPRGTLVVRSSSQGDNLLFLLLPICGYPHMLKKAGIFYLRKKMIISTYMISQKVLFIYQFH